MNPRSFVRTGAGAVTALVIAIAACDGGEGPTNPGGPALSGITPDEGDVGDRATMVAVSLTGSGFDAGEVEVNVSGSGVDVGNVSVTGPTSLRANFFIASGTHTGERNVTVSTDAGTSDAVPFRIGRDRGHQSHLIKVYDNYPGPKFLTVEVGEPVVWENVGQNDHTVSTYGTPYEWENTLIKPGEIFFHTFTEPGEYGFICALHQVVGNVTVVEAGSMADMDGYDDMDDMDDMDGMDGMDGMDDMDGMDGMDDMDGMDGMDGNMMEP